MRAFQAGFRAVVNQKGKELWPTSVIGFERGARTGVQTNFVYHGTKARGNQSGQDKKDGQSEHDRSSLRMRRTGKGCGRRERDVDHESVSWLRVVRWRPTNDGRGKAPEFPDTLMSAMDVQLKKGGGKARSAAVYKKSLEQQRGGPWNKKAVTRVKSICAYGVEEVLGRQIVVRHKISAC